jgi:adenylate cyclase
MFTSSRREGDDARITGGVRLRPTLIATIVGAVLLTALAIGGSTIMLTLHGARTLIDQTRISAVASATEAIHDFFAAAPYNTNELAGAARHGALPLAQPDKLAALFAERLSDHPQLAWIGYGDRKTGRYVGAARNEVVFAPIPVAGNLGFDVAVVVNLADITDGIVRQALIAGAIALGATLLAILIGAGLAARIARPVVVIAADLAAVGAFAISRVPAPRSFVREIAELGQSVERMKASLNSFGRYVPRDLVRTLLMAGSEATLGGEIRRLSIFFSDIADFTAISEGMAPHLLVAAMGRYFETMTEAIARYGGTIDKFMGDGVMAFFNAPLALADHPRQACLAALAAQAALARLYCECSPEEPVFRTRIGLGLGDVLVGNIGTPERFAYTIIGDEVNLASRCEGLNKLYGTAIIASDPLASAAGDGFEWRRLDRVAVKGRRQGTLIRELLGEESAVAADILTARDLYERALDAYFAGDFTAAAAGFLAAREARPGDLAARMLARRARALAAAPPAAWTGIHAMNEK